MCVDDFSRYTGVDFLRQKFEAFEIFKRLCLNIENEQNLKVERIRSDHKREFENENFQTFCEAKGIHHEYSAPKTPQQNGVIGRKNRTLREMVRVMMKAKDMPHIFWAEAMCIACHIINRVYLILDTKVTPYQIWRDIKPNIKYFHIFGNTFYVINHREQGRKLDDKGQKGIFLGYSPNNCAYRVYQKEN